MAFSYKNIIKRVYVEFYVNICISKDHWGKKLCVSGLYQALAQYSTFCINMDTIISINLLTLYSCRNYLYNCLILHDWNFMLIRTTTPRFPPPSSFWQPTFSFLLQWIWLLQISHISRIILLSIIILLSLISPRFIPIRLYDRIFFLLWQNSPLCICVSVCVCVYI